MRTTSIAITTAIAVLTWLGAAEADKRNASTVVPRPPRLAPEIKVSSPKAGVTPLSLERERGLKPNDSFKECDTCPEMVLVPAGSFTMGSPINETGRDSDEGPQRHVRLPRIFAVGRFEVTVDQFAAFVKETGYDASSKCGTVEQGKFEERPGRSWRNPGFVQTGTHPVTCVNWNDVKAYLAWLSRKTGQGYRLLTEAEWEYVARAGTSTRYNFGVSEKGICNNGNGADQNAKRLIPDTSSWTFSTCDDGYAYTAPVGSFFANGFGLYDVHGNVWEWTEDCWNGSYNGAPTDGSAWIAGDCRLRVMRGGSWLDFPRYLRSADRYWYTFDVQNYDFGFRVARALRELNR